MWRHLITKNRTHINMLNLLSVCSLINAQLTTLSTVVPENMQLHFGHSDKRGNKKSKDEAYSDNLDSNWKPLHGTIRAVYKPGRQGGNAFKRVNHTIGNCLLTRSLVCAWSIDWNLEEKREEKCYYNFGGTFNCRRCCWWVIQPFIAHDLFSQSVDCENNVR